MRARKEAPGAGEMGHSGWRSRAYHHGNLRQALIDAALELVVTKGPKGFSLRAAARRAGVSQAAPYRHFESREALLAAVAEGGFRQLSASMKAATSAAGTGPVARLRAVGLAYIRFAREHPAHFRVMFGPGVADRHSYPSLEEAGGETFGILMEAVEEGQKAGLMHEGDPQDLAATAWATVHGLSGLLVDGQIASLGLDQGGVDRLAETVTTVLFVGLGIRESE